MSTSKIIFIGGCPRSGTTLLQRILCSGEPAAPMLSEPLLLLDLVASYSKRMSKNRKQVLDYFASDAEAKEFFAGNVRDMLDRVAGQHKASALVLRSPGLTTHFPLLATVLPTAKFLVIAREPKDVIASMLQVGRRIQMQGRPHFYQERDIPALCNNLKSHYVQVLNSRDPAFLQVRRVVRYENLVNDYQGLLQDMGNFSGIALPADTQAILSNPAIANDDNDPWITPLSSAAVSTEALGKYSDVLNEHEVRAIETLTEDFRKAMGYV